MCKKQENRGLVVQQGGAKALIPLATEGTKLGKQKAAHALAKIAITNNPAIAFPGQRVGFFTLPNCNGNENAWQLKPLPFIFDVLLFSVKAQKLNTECFRKFYGDHLVTLTYDP